MSRYKKELVGKIGEWHVQAELAKIGIDSVSIDKTFDLYLWQRNHRIELKTSYPRIRTSNKEVFAFNFSEDQRVMDAFDYAVCVGLNHDDTVNTVYIIPQTFLALHNNTAKNLQIKIYVKRGNFYNVCNSFDKFKPAREVGLDIFLENNKASFTRKKNHLTKKLLQNEKTLQKSFKKKFLEYFKNGGRVEGAMKEFDLGFTTVARYRKQFGMKVALGKYVRKPFRNYKGSVNDAKKDIKKLWEKGHTRTEIMRILKIADKKVSSMCRELNLPHTNPNRNRKKK